MTDTLALSAFDQETKQFVDVDSLGWPEPEAFGAKDLCRKCGHRRSRHIDNQFDCCQIISRTVNMVNDILPHEVEQSTVCDCAEFVS